MRIHHLNGATLCPVGRRLLLGRPDGLLVCHCLLIETEQGLVLVDTALGLEDCQGTPRESMRRGMSTLRPAWDEAQTMARRPLIPRSTIDDSEYVSETEAMMAAF